MALTVWPERCETCDQLSQVEGPVSGHVARNRALVDSAEHGEPLTHSGYLARCLLLLRGSEPERSAVQPGVRVALANLQRPRRPESAPAK